MSTTELRDVPGYEGRYATTSDGRVWSHISRRWLKSYRTYGGYLRIELQGRITMGVHRLVALAWIANPNSLPQVNHLDGDKRHNAALNLEWCDASRNQLHAVQMGLTRRSGPCYPKWTKLDRQKVADIKARLLRGERRGAIAAIYGVTPENISLIKCARIWRDVMPS